MAIQESDELLYGNTHTYVQGSRIAEPTMSLSDHSSLSQKRITVGALCVDLERLQRRERSCVERIHIEQSYGKTHTYV